MDRRLLTVLGMSIALALVVSGVFYQVAVRSGSSKKSKDTGQFRDLVTAALPIPVGTTIKPDQLKINRIPANLFPKGGFSKIEEVLDRPVASNILADDPIIEGRLAARGSGLGLATKIPPGMRAISVRVNDVVGVAGFVFPGMFVDVLVTGRPPEYVGTMTRTVLQNVLVLSAGQTIQVDPRGQAINTPVVTLAVSPEQAEVLTLSNSEGRIQLVLRNSNDQKIAATPGSELTTLYGTRKNPAAEPDAQPKPRPQPSPPVQLAASQPVVRAAPAPEEVVMIRGNQKTVEAVGSRPLSR